MEGIGRAAEGWRAFFCLWVRKQLAGIISTKQSTVTDYFGEVSHLVSDSDFEKQMLSIDAELKAEGVAPHARPIHAVRKFGMLHGKSMLIAKPSFLPEDVAGPAFEETKRIYDWYELHYGERLNVDPSAGARIASMADGDIWEMNLPLIFGSCTIFSNRDFVLAENELRRGGTSMNACSSLSGLTAQRLSKFSDGDLQEVQSCMIFGLQCRKALSRFRGTNHYFDQVIGDLSNSTHQLVGQIPNFGQSKWASAQMVEKFMKGLIEASGNGDSKQGHNLLKLHRELKKSIPSLNLEPRLKEILCTAE
ncbi:hypothetical protein [Mesobacterium pallidum]|uniref:hypothetical protein n=1 Tax=Mesobacterium pallidum TaxID=2872037 RepID=UPI001EE1E86D|nr:hypothetical protein [Mesobacterium pallidum]